MVFLLMNNMSEGIDIVAELMALSAKNTPTALGESYLDIIILDEAEKEILVEEMYQLADELDNEGYTKKGEEIENSDKVLLIGLNDHPSLGIDCKACGFDSCEDFERADKKEDIFLGPNCIFRIIDLGLALGNALRTAGNHNVDAEIMIRGGLAAKDLGLSTSRICLAIPISLKPKYDYFEL